MNAVVIVAGGSGRRAGGPLPKQYITIGGKAIVLHTIDCFFRFDPDIRVILVLAPGHEDHWKKVSTGYDRSDEVILAKGGETRSRSVRNGLIYVEDGWIVGIHDAVRPFVSPETIGRCYRAAEESGSGIPVVEMDQSVRMIGPEHGSASLDRSRLRRVQTPQVFRSELIRKAYQNAGDQSYTDDASVYEALYGNVGLVEGNIENIKITTRVDLQLAQLLLQEGDVQRGRYSG
jgi:2-C-methyl-D-erythritol 4-phosphate cytidylyltransferase